MKIFINYLVLVLSTIIILIVTAVVNAQIGITTVLPVKRKALASRIKDLKYSISKGEERLKYLNDILRKIETGKYYIIRDEKGKLSLELKKDFLKKLNELKPWEVINRVEAVKRDTKVEYDKLFKDCRSLSNQIDREKIWLANIEKEYNKTFQEGRGYIEVKINKEKFSRPGKNLVRWDWQFRFDEINGVGVTIKQVWIRGYRGEKEKMNRRLPSNHRIEPFGSEFIDTPYMQFGTKYDKTSPGTMRYVYTGTDDNGNEVKAEFEMTRWPR
jgi:hypothetical protein